VGETRERIVEAGQRMLRTRSYLGFSFNDIAEEVGVRKATLHHHFASKEALGIELLAAVGERFRAWCRSAPAEPAAALRAFVDLYRSTLRAGEAVCPGGAFVPGWGCTSEALQSAVRQLRAEQIDWLAGVFRAQDDRRSPAEAKALAASVFATCQGALASARVTGKAKDFDAATTLLRALWTTTA
jgi:TetR/AcrR family transcriptional repressor of nem operon